MSTRGTPTSSKGRVLDDTADDNPVGDLVAAALGGSSSAWSRLVERYTPLVLSIVRRHRLTPDDAEDVVQTVWLRLVEHLAQVREPRALPGWIVTTARHECLRLLRAGRVSVPTDLGEHSEDVRREPPPTVDAALLVAERHLALLAAVAELPEHQRSVILLLIEDPPVSYEEISRRLQIPVGSIGPTRARAFARIRAFPAMAELLSG